MKGDANMDKVTYTIKPSKKGYVLYENGVVFDVFSRAFGFDTLEKVIRHLEAYNPVVFKNLDV